MKGIVLALINDFIEEVGDEVAKTIISDFSCPLNIDVELFLKDKALEFSKLHYSQTFLVFMSYKDKPVLVGYFALANKSIVIPKRLLSARWQRRISRYAQYDSESKSYSLAIPLIGQLGKNFCNGYNKLISGDILLKLACDCVQEAQRIIGGKMVYLECENIDKLKRFYNDNGFVEFGLRDLDNDEIGMLKTEKLVQMFRYFD